MSTLSDEIGNRIFTWAKDNNLDRITVAEIKELSTALTCLVVGYQTAKRLNEKKEKEDIPI